MKKLVEILERHFKLTGKESGGQILFYFLQDSGLLKKYLDPKTEQEQLAGLNMARFFEKVKSFESQNHEVQINDLLDWITLRLEMGESPLAAEIDWTNVNAVNILTIHSAKGLEFPVVFLVNLVDRRFPTTQRTETIPVPQPLIKEILPEGNSHEQEERRLFYVGMTRAKDRLFLSAANFYHEAKTRKRLSPFVVEAMGEKEISRFKNQKQTQVVNPQLSLLEWGKKKCEPAEQVNFNTPVTHLSISQIETFDICERQYKYRYVLSIPTLPTPSLTQGNIIHQTLKTFYQQQLVSNKKLSLKQLLKILTDSWSSEGFSSKAQQEAAKKSAVRMMTNFYEQEFKFESIGQVLALEQPFALRLTPTLKVGGRIDRIDNIGQDGIEIIDYKTGTKTPTQKEVDQDKQLTLYALAAASISLPPLGKPLEKIKLSLYYLDEGKKFSTRRQETDVEKIKEKIFSTAQAIEKTNFPPKPNRPFPCNYCEFRLICDAWK